LQILIHLKIKIPILTAAVLKNLHYNKFAVGSTEQLNISGFDSIGLTNPFSYHGQLNGMKFT